MTNADAEFGYGVSHIDPVKAINLGNVSGYPKNFSGSVMDLNHPSIMFVDANTTFSRTVTDVGAANSTYKATITSPSNLKIDIRPNVLGPQVHK
ncbi:hypothetical protein IFM89_018909 [Coptis chinensis]|uniref:Subtilisin-like protease fibronectin type-III domain-containing protein n=1 Tax=Coptis chinensis TaxID=261450 RepID=A0A835HIG5_9MAGN|nr:hypothetical protein IFM89_018909 [Coptis chinensis]